MRKKLFYAAAILILWVAATSAHGQDKFQEVYKVPKMSKQQIYDRALAWTAESFVDAKSVIQMNDRDVGKIIGRGTARFGFGTPAEYTMIIEAKDGRYRVTFKDFIALWGNPPGSWRRPVKKAKYLNQLIDNSRSLASSLFSFMQKADQEDEKW